MKEILIWDKKQDKESCNTLMAQHMMEIGWKERKMALEQWHGKMKVNMMEASRWIGGMVLAITPLLDTHITVITWMTRCMGKAQLQELVHGGGKIHLKDIGILEESLAMEPLHMVEQGINMKFRLIKRKCRKFNFFKESKTKRLTIWSFRKWLSLQIWERRNLNRYRESMINKKSLTY